METTLIKNWNSCVGEHDLVYHLGDFAFGNKEYISQLVSQLHGRICLIKGNHDRYNNQYYRDCGFAEIYDKPILIDDFFLLSHMRQWSIAESCIINLFGHVHNDDTYETVGRNHFCACVERINYTPVDFEEIKKKFGMLKVLEKKLISST